MSTTAGTQGVHDQPIHVRVNGQDGSEIFFKLKRSVKLIKLMTAYCNQRSIQMSSTAFLFDGGRLHPEETPYEVGMEDGDEIDAVIHQTGGSISRSLG